MSSDLSWLDIWKILGAFGGLAAISGAVAAFVGNHVSTRLIQAQKATLDRQLETHKDALVRDADRARLLLKRQELMFEREYGAAADFFRVLAKVVPAPWAPDLDWAEAQTRIAENLFQHEQRLRKFIGQHSASLGDEVRRLIGSATTLANEGGFEVAQETDEGDYPPGGFPSDRVCKIVDEFYETMLKAEKQIRNDLRNGSFS